MKKIKYLISIVSALFVFFFLAAGSAGAAAPIGNYLELNGGYAKSSNNDSTSPAAFSFEAWIKPQSLSGIQNILWIGNKMGAGSNDYYTVGINGGSVSFTYRYDTNSFVSMNAGLLDGSKWQHIAVTAAANSARIYIDGVPMLSPDFPNGTFRSIGPDVTLGDGFKGAIDEVRISKISRDVSTLWSNGTYNSPLITDNSTVLLWHLDESRGSSLANDASVNNLDGNLIGGDSLIHFFGVLPTPTPWTLALPTLSMPRWVLPTLAMPGGGANPFPTIQNPQPTTINVRGWARPTRSVGR